MSGHHGKRGRITGRGPATDEFSHSHPCPSTGKPSEPCPGYVIGGSNDPSNMRWQATRAPM